MASSYLVPGWPWYINDQRLFFGMAEVRKADLATFQPLSDFWGRDANRVYCAGSEIRGADVATFRVLNPLYATDARRAYTITGPIREADVASFQAIGPTEHTFNSPNGYAKDARFVYHTSFGGKACVINGADAASFTPCGHGYASDRMAVYFERSKLPGADPAKWRHIRGVHSHSDKYGYWINKRIRGVNGNRLELLPYVELGDHWCRDDKGYYYRDAPADPREYLQKFRRCFILIGKVANVELTRDQTIPLDPSRPESWAIATHAWIDVDCKEWIQKPDVEVADAPRIGQLFRFGQGLHLALLSAREWMQEDRIWIFTPYQRPDKRVVLLSSQVWWEHSTLDQLDSIRKTIDAAASA